MFWWVSQGEKPLTKFFISWYPKEQPSWSRHETAPLQEHSDVSGGRFQTATTPPDLRISLRMQLTTFAAKVSNPLVSHTPDFMRNYQKLAHHLALDLKDFHKKNLYSFAKFSFSLCLPFLCENLCHGYWDRNCKGNRPHHIHSCYWRVGLCSPALSAPNIQVSEQSSRGHATSSQCKGYWRPLRRWIFVEDTENVAQPRMKDKFVGS